MRAEPPERDWCSHRRDPPRSRVSLQGKEAVYEEQVVPRSWNFLTSRIVRHKSLLFLNRPAAHLVQQPEQTKTAAQVVSAGWALKKNPEADSTCVLATLLGYFL